MRLPPDATKTRSNRRELLFPRALLFRSHPERRGERPRGGASRPWLPGHLVTRLLATGYGTRVSCNSLMLLGNYRFSYPLTYPNNYPGMYPGYYPEFCTTRSKGPDTSRLHRPCVSWPARRWACSRAYEQQVTLARAVGRRARANPSRRTHQSNLRCGCACSAGGVLR